MVEEIWTLRLFKHEQGGEQTDVVVKSMEEQNITHVKLVFMMRDYGYAPGDDVFYAGPESYLSGSLTKIRGETHVMDMIREYGCTKKVDLHLFKTTVASAQSPTNTAVEFYKEHRSMDEVVVVDDETDAEFLLEEEIDPVHRLQEMAKRRADPRFHDEGDTDVEDIFEGLISQQPEEEEGALMSNAAKGRAKQKCRRKQRKGKGKKTSECSLARNGGAELSEPSSESGGMSALDEDTDPENLPPFGKRRRSKAVRQKRKYFDEKNIMDPTQLDVGICFSDATQFRLALKTWHIVQGRDYAYMKNNRDRIKVRCKEEGFDCDFHMLASQVGSEKTFMLRQLTAHTCPASRGSSRIDSTWLSKQYEDNFRSDPDWKLKPFMDQCLRDLGTDVTKTMAYRAKRKAGDKVLGSHKQQYKRVRDYLQTIIDTNPGSVAIVTTEDRIDQGLPPQFSGLFICLNAQKRGFIEGCRPFISIDGCFVKLSNGAQILAASGRDGNNNMFPIAFGVVGAEDTENWTWFLETLKSAIGSGEEYGGWTIMSDRQKGLLNAVASVFPNCDHRFCKRHLLLNMALKGWRGDKYKKLVDAACYATTEWDYNQAMENLKNFNEKAWKWLQDIGEKHFSRHAFSGRAKTDLVVNNLSEVFNKWILESRDKPIVTMCEDIRRAVMTRCAGKREGGSKARWDITPVVAGKLELEKRDSRYCTPYKAGFHLYEVHCSDRTYGVDLNARTCDCNRWQLTGIPCKHACSALYQRKELPENYVHACFKKAAYLRAYAHIVYPVVGEHAWTRTNTPDIDPPRFRKQAGRPKTKRRRGVDEGPKVTGRPRMTTVTCSNCGSHKHNYRTCGNTLRPDLQLRLDALQQSNEQQADGGNVDGGAAVGSVDGESAGGPYGGNVHGESAGDPFTGEGNSYGAGPSSAPPAYAIPPRGRGRLAYFLGM